MSPNNINVLITGVGSASIGIQILKALRLSDLKYNIIGTDTNPLSYGLSSVDKKYIVPQANDPLYKNCIINIIKENNVQVLLPGSEAELKFFSDSLKIFEELGVFLPINLPPFIDLCMNKHKTMNFLEKNQLSVPKTILIHSLQDLDPIDFFPVVCKPHLNSGGSNNVFIAQNKKEVKLLAEYLFLQMDEFLLQEYIGTPAQEYTVGVLLDMEGEILGSIALKRFLDASLSCKIKVKNHTSREELGKSLVISSGISQGEMTSYPELTQYCEQVAKIMGARGAINIQCRYFNDQFYIFEINPRFSGTTSLRAMVGFNEPDILIRKYILKEKISKVSYSQAIILRDLEEKIIDTNLNLSNNQP